MKKIFFSLIAFLFVMVSAIAQRTVSGRVVDDTGEGLPGVNVVIKGTTSGTTTDLDGNYRLTVNDNDILVYSYVGFESQELSVGSRSVIDITMSGITELQEVVVVGFGSTSRRALTGAISSVDGEDLQGFNAQSIDQVLQGRSAGVSVSSTGGFLGAPVTVRVRGASSISSSSQPLYVVDGIPVTSDIEGSNLGGGTGGGMNSLLNLNPNDIGSIEILKDAAATAIYGARASNGVVLITTKRGSKGAPSVNINYQAGQTDYTDLPPYMNGQQFTESWNYGMRDAGQTDGSPFLLDETNVINTDWIDLVTRRGFAQELSTNVSGGTESTTYYLGATYNSTENYIIDNDMKRYNFVANVGQDIGDKWRVEMKLQPSRSELSRAWESNSVQAPLTYSGLIYPNIPYRDETTGELIVTGGVNPFGLPFNSTPLIDIKEAEFNSTTTQVLANLSLQFQPTDWLTLRSEGAVDHWQLQELRRDGSRTTNGNPTGQGLVRNTQIFNWNVNNIASIKTFIGNDHTFDITVANQIQKTIRDQFNATGVGFPSDQLKTLNLAAVITGAGQTQTAYTFVGFLGRVNYGLRDRYLFSVIGRYDGTSRFVGKNKWGFFPAASAGWIISDESFFSNVGAVSFLKLRASIGQQGNAELQSAGADNNFGAIPLFTSGQTNNTNSFYNDNGGLSFQQLPNPDLRWETTTQLDLGIDFTLLDERIGGSIGYYQKFTDDLLLNLPISGTNGVTTYGVNAGKMENRGFELELNAQVLPATSQVSWSIGFNISTLTNEVTELLDTDGDGLPNDIINSENIVRVGEPVGSFYVVPYAGVDAANGDALWFDQNGETTNAFSLVNRRIVGNPFPDYFGGFNTTVRWNGFDFGAFFQFSVGNDIYLADGEFNLTGLTSIFNNLAEVATDSWTPQNPNAKHPEIRGILQAANGSQAQNGRYVQDASFMRLKTVSLGYTFPESIIGDTFRNLRVYIQGQNLLTVKDKDFTGYDVEGNFAANDNIQAGNTFFGAPQMKQISMGVNVGF